MIKINVVARIADDKNHFLDLIYLLHKLKEENINDVQVLFIGAIQNYGIYENILNMANLLSVSSQIAFTKASIRINDLSPEIKQGYFLHFCAGDFIGYSGIESINDGLKNIFYNADRQIRPDTGTTSYVCADINSLIEFVKRLTRDQAFVDQEIKQNSIKILNDFVLMPNDKTILLSMLISEK
jgi:hypothetical protein